MTFVVTLSEKWSNVWTLQFISRVYVWVHDNLRGIFRRRPEEREQIFFQGNRLTINILPADAELAAVVYEADPEKGLRMTDHKTFSLEVTEFSTI